MSNVLLICITHLNLSNKLCCADEGSRVPSESRFRTAFCKNSLCICNNSLSKYNNNTPPKMTRGNRPTFLLYIAASFFCCQNRIKSIRYFSKFEFTLISGFPGRFPLFVGFLLFLCCAKNANIISNYFLRENILRGFKKIDTFEKKNSVNE